MRKEKSESNSGQAIRKQLARVEKLRELPFDNPCYEKWRIETGLVLDHVFGLLQSEQHPCTRAFLNYRIPEHFTATRAEMQEYYQNILRYQADLLRMYLEDIEDLDSPSSVASITSD
ncbi:MAG TPA: hypothetical protein VJZ91_11800 [Blastocatellia bacterium]|nr:hypothetical protein [Blastocatellia bacterium]